MTAINISAFTKKISDRDFERLCADNPETRFETTPQGKLIIMSPTGSESGRKNGRLFFQVELWNTKTKLGVSFDSSTGFKLSNGALRSPDVSWVELAQWNSLSEQQQRKFAPIDPDFVIELMSPTDDLNELQQKMTEYMNCGVKLGWLINPDEKQVEIYRNGQNKEVLNNPQSLSGEDILPGLIVDLSSILD
ncbi:MAG: Uma2 family endonuclease [Waterburya sp.]